MFCLGVEFPSQVNFLQANLAREAGVKNAFTHADGEFDYV
jgi:hypothetical protein